MTDPVEVIARAIASEQELGDRWWLYEEEARAALSALEGDGMVVVPVEPTEEMMHSGARAHDHPSVYMGGPSHAGRKMAERIWSAMLTAARPR
jgi:hypothetical protein